MNRIGLLVAGLAMLAGCGGSSYDDFTGNWGGVLNGSYSCNDGSTVQVAFTSEQYNITQSGPNADISVAFCNGLVIDGTASGSTLSVISTGDITSACTQTDATGATTISINDFSGGTFSYDGANLDVNLTEDVQINGLPCTGTASGQLGPS